MRAAVRSAHRSAHTRRVCCCVGLRAPRLVTLHELSSGETDEVGRTPVMVAAWRGALRALTVLLAGSDLDLADKDKRTGSISDS